MHPAIPQGAARMLVGLTDRASLLVTDGVEILILRNRRARSVPRLSFLVVLTLDCFQIFTGLTHA